MPTTVIGPHPGLTVLGAATAFPSLELDNVAVLERIAEIRGRSADPERIAFSAQAMTDEHGLQHRAWTHKVGEPLSSEEETAVDLGLRAARAALEDAGIEASEVGALLVATSSPHRMTSTVSAAIGAGLGVQAMCMDTRAGCASGLFALSTAALYISAGVAPILVIGAETFSKVIPPGYPEAVISLADGAAALVLGQGSGTLLAAALETDGKLGGLVNTPGPMPPTAEAVAADAYKLAGEPSGLKDAIPERYVWALRAALERAGLTVDDLDAYIPHQVGKQVVHKVCATLDLPLDKAWIAPERHANVGAAGWMVALVEARQAGWLAPGRTIGLASVGGGMSWAAVVIRT